MRHTLRRLLVPSTLLVACAALPTAHAQLLSVYGTFSPLHASNVATGSVATGSGYTEQYTSFWTPAFGGGITFNFLNLHVVKLGLDARGSTKRGTTGADTAELGLRLGFQPPLLRLKPYVQGGVGYLATRTTNVSTTSTGGTPVGGTFSNDYATVGFHAGVDKPLIPFLDFRIIEAGYTHAFTTGTSSGGINNANTFSLSTGLVAHF